MRWNSHMELPHPLVRKVPRNIYSLSCSTSILNVRPERSSSRFERAASHTHCGSSPSACLCVCLLCLSLPGCLCLRVRLLGPVLPCASGRFFFMLASHRWQHSPPRSTHQHASRQCQKGRRALNAHSALWSWAASVTTNDISCISSLHSGQQINNLWALPDACARPRHVAMIQAPMWINFLGKWEVSVLNGSGKSRASSRKSAGPRRPAESVSPPTPAPSSKARPTCCPFAEVELRHAGSSLTFVTASDTASMSDVRLCTPAYA